MTYELYHHGILGQKWGIRRYQNADGTLTEAGLKRRAKQLYRHVEGPDKQFLKDGKVRQRQAGVRSGFFSDKLKTGSSMTRYSSNPNETIDARRKYVSVNKSDIETYRDDAKYGGLGFKDKTYYGLKYTSDKDLKIARGVNVAKHTVNQYGNQKIKEDLGFLLKSRVMDQVDKTHKGTQDKTSPDYQTYSYVQKKQNEVAKFLNDVFKDETKFRDLSKHYEKRGYDAIVDAEDYIRGYYYPLIVLNPKQSKLRKTGKTTKYSY